MPEMANSCERHGKSGVVGGLDHFVVANRSAGLNNRGGAGFRHRQQSVRERKECIGGCRRTFGQRLRPARGFAPLRAP